MKITNEMVENACRAAYPGWDEIIKEAERVWKRKQMHSALSAALQSAADTPAPPYAQMVVDVDNEDDSLILEVAKAIALHGVGREWDDFLPVNAYDIDHCDLTEYARAAIYASPIAQLEQAERLTFETSARLLRERDHARAALKSAIGHLEHMAAWFSKRGTGYSFESLGEDMPGIKAALAASATEGSVE